VRQMGGAKKKSMAQMEKAQVLQEKKTETTKKTKGKPVVEKKSRGTDMPDVNDSKFIAELTKIGAVTPYAVASQFNLRISAARDLLEELERRKLIRPIGGNSRVRIYQVAAA